MNDLDEIRKRINKRRGKILTDYHFTKLYNAMTKLMVIMIVGLAVLSYVKISPNGTYIKDYILNSDYYETISLWISEHIFFSVNDMNVSTNISYTHVSDNYYTSSSNEVLNFDNGRVIYVGEQDILGNYVTVLLANGVEVTYGQMNDIFVSAYDSVEAATILGTYDDRLIMIFTKGDNEIDYSSFLELLS
ncbi:MAG: M23 family metallopeptidase [Erysipelotrichaceae bacterium]|nr:M23 family metallopeptidase [Erysipelotrichaceae bacterium]